MTRTARSERKTHTEAVANRFVTGVCVAVTTAIVIYAWLALALKSPHSKGWDFPVFYIAAHLPVHLLYHHAAFASFAQEHLAPLGIEYYPPFYIRPAVFSVLYRPMMGMPYWDAFWVWAAAGLSAYVLSVLILMRRFHLPGFLLPAYLVFFPALMGIISGQDIGTYLLVLTAAFLLLDKESDAIAGLAFALCVYKFNLILLIPVMLLLRRRYKALTWFAFGVVSLAAASIVLAPAREYIRVLVDGPKQIPGFFPVGLRGFGAAVHQAWCYPVLTLLVVIICVWLMKLLPLPEAFSAAVTGTLLISPYVTWYDSTLLALPLSIIFARGGKMARVFCVAALLVIPLWINGGGFSNKAGGFMHVAVEASILAYFVRAALLGRGLLVPSRSKALLEHEPLPRT
jgi:hypothetical protein